MSSKRLGCLVAAVALLGPRIGLVLLWVMGHAVQTAFQSIVYPVIGVIFLPLTALAYALAADPSGAVGGAALVWPVAGFVADVAMLGSGIYWAVEYRLE